MSLLFLSVLRLVGLTPRALVVY